MALTIKTQEGLGYLPDQPDQRDYLFADTAPLMAIEAPIREPVSHIVKDFYKKLPTAYNQFNIGSCVANAVGAMFCFVRNVFPRSRLQMYYEARRLINMTEVDSGCYIRDMMKVTSQLGAGRETWWPYDVNKFKIDPPLKVDRDALLRRIMTYYRVQGREEFRRCLLENHPFATGIAIYDSFYTPNAERFGIIPTPQRTEKSHGGHAILCIGYDDDFINSAWAKEAVAAGYPLHGIPKQVYIMRNSWDFAIDAAYVENPYLCRDSWTQRKYEVGTNA